MFRNSRRSFLRGTGSLIALPVLESLGYKSFAAEKNHLPPKRMVFLSFGWGVTSETWFPDLKVSGKDYKLPPGLAPLKRHKNDITVIQGLTNKFNNEPHWGSTFWLTGANRYSKPGQNLSNSISADQVAASYLGKDTRYSSIQLNSFDRDGGHGPGLSLAWDVRGKPIAGWNNPTIAFHRLFSDDKTPLSERMAMLNRKKSILDSARLDAKSVKRGLTQNDIDKLDEYLQSIRDIEIRLSKDERWLSIPKVKPPITEPRTGLNGKEEIKVFYDLIVAALQTDSTRVITYRQPVNSLLNSLGLNIAAHDMSHYSPGERMEKSQKRDTAQSELLAGLIDKLKKVKEPDGSSLFDHTSLVYGSNIRSIHFLDNPPTLLAGGGANIKLGEHIVLPEGTPLCNVWLTLLQGSGVKVNSHGDSTGIVKELLT